MGEEGEAGYEFGRGTWRDPERVGGGSNYNKNYTCMKFSVLENAS